MSYNISDMWNTNCETCWKLPSIPDIRKQSPAPIVYCNDEEVTRNPAINVYFKMASLDIRFLGEDCTPFMNLCFEQFSLKLSCDAISHAPICADLTLKHLLVSYNSHSFSASSCRKRYFNLIIYYRIYIIIYVYLSKCNYLTKLMPSHRYIRRKDTFHISLIIAYH